MAIIYEVTLHIDRDIADEYDVWLGQHIAEMLTLPGFLGAELATIEDDQEEPAQAGRVVHYRLEDRAALEAYFRDRAERMRDEGVRRFGNRVHASRRILHPTT